MTVLQLVLLVAAAVLAALAAFGVGGRVNLLAAAFLCFVLAILLQPLAVALS